MYDCSQQTKQWQTMREKFTDDDRKHWLPEHKIHLNTAMQ